jgi:hypothetical protein
MKVQLKDASKFMWSKHLNTKERRGKTIESIEINLPSRGRIRNSNRLKSFHQFDDQSHLGWTNIGTMVKTKNHKKNSKLFLNIIKSQIYRFSCLSWPLRSLTQEVEGTIVWVLVGPGLPKSIGNQWVIAVPSQSRSLKCKFECSGLDNCWSCFNFWIHRPSIGSNKVYELGTSLLVLIN